MTVNDGPLFRLPFGVVFPYALVAPAIGVALGALQHFREQARARVFRDGARVMEDPFVQFRVADAAAEVDAAHARMRHNFEEMMALASAGREIPLESRARYRWDAAKATAWCVQAVDRLFEARGGRADFLHNPIHRAWRELDSLRAHAGHNPGKAALIICCSGLGLAPPELRF